MPVLQQVLVLNHLVYGVEGTVRGRGCDRGGIMSRSVEHPRVNSRLPPSLYVFLTLVRWCITNINWLAKGRDESGRKRGESKSRKDYESVVICIWGSVWWRGENTIARHAMYWRIILRHVWTKLYLLSVSCKCHRFRCLIAKYYWMKLCQSF